jgi:hypothetical protein
MKGLRTGLHPTFEALSAHADASGEVSTSTRAARHVAQCAHCRAQVAEIRALGEAARGMAVAHAPADLWSRIETAARTTPPGSGRVHLPSASVERPTGASRRHRALAGVVAMTVVAIAAVALWPRPSSLQAAGPSRLTFSPARPVPGGAVKVRYLAPPGAPAPSRLVLVGRFARPAGHNPQRLWGRSVDELADSLAELVRAGDGAFVATVRLPADFLALSLAVHDPAADRLDLDGAAPWMVIGGAAAGGPSLPSLLAAHDTRSGLFNLAARNVPRQAVDIADSLKRYFPRHPAGWAFTHSYGVSRGRFDYLRFFEGAERKYASLFDALWPQPTLDAERLHDMVVFARNIDEGSEVLRWSGRLAKEHPEDPRALSDLAGGLHELELAGSPLAGDSIRRWLPMLDMAYRRAPVPNTGYFDGRRLAERHGDSATRALWIARDAENGHVGNVWLTAQRAARGGGDSALAEVRRRAEGRCTLPAGRLPLAASVGEWRARCEFYRGIAYGFLSSLTLQIGQPRQALVEADSAIVAVRRGELCTWPGGDLAHARAALALGDTAMAESDFIAAAARYPGGPAQALDTAQARLGTRFDRAAATVRLESARQAVQACEAEVRPRRQARERGRADQN